MPSAQHDFFMASSITLPALNYSKGLYTAIHANQYAAIPAQRWPRAWAVCCGIAVGRVGMERQKSSSAHTVNFQHKQQGKELGASQVPCGLGGLQCLQVTWPTGSSLPLLLTLFFPFCCSMASLSSLVSFSRHDTCDSSSLRLGAGKRMVRFQSWLQELTSSLPGHLAQPEIPPICLGIRFQKSLSSCLASFSTHLKRQESGQGPESELEVRFLRRSFF